MPLSDISVELVRPALRLLEKFGMAETHGVRGESRGALHFQYDVDADLLFARYGNPEVCDNVQVDDNVVVRVSRQTHRSVGIEVFGVSERFQKSPNAITRVFARQLLAQYGPEAEAKVRRA